MIGIPPMTGYSLQPHVKIPNSISFPGEADGVLAERGPPQWGQRSWPRRSVRM